MGAYLERTDFTIQLISGQGNLRVKFGTFLFHCSCYTSTNIISDWVINLCMRAGIPRLKARLIGRWSCKGAFEYNRADRDLVGVILAGFGIQQGGQPDTCLLIIFSSTAYITDPGWEIWHSDQFFAQPGEVGDIFQVHYACGTFAAWIIAGSLRCAHRLNLFN